MAEWTRVTNTTINNHLRDEEANIMRNRKLTAMLQGRGRVKYNCTGKGVDWRVRYKRAPLMGFGDADTLAFPRRNRWKTAELDIRGYIAGESATKKERLMNKGTEAIVKFFSELADTQREDFEDAFCDELYIDGEATGNTKRIHGFESFLKAGSNTINISGGAERSANAADLVAAPSATYAGISTALGGIGGTWTGSFPSGTASVDQSFDSWSPLLVNWSSDGWAATSDTFAVTGKEAVRFLLQYSHRNKTKKGMMDLVMLDRALYIDFLNLLDDNERFLSKQGSPTGSLMSFGFNDVVNFDGAEITSEYGMPSNTGFGINIDHLQLLSWQKQLFVAEGPDFDPGSQSYRMSIDFYGNLKANPRFQGKLYNYAT